MRRLWQLLRTGNALLEIVDSPSNGMTYDCGVTLETGEDPLEVLQYMGSGIGLTTFITAMLLWKALCEVFGSFF
jgi:hypothetical protein